MLTGDTNSRPFLVAEKAHIPVRLVVFIILGTIQNSQEHTKKRTKNKVPPLKKKQKKHEVRYTEGYIGTGITPLMYSTATLL